MKLTLKKTLLITTSTLLTLTCTKLTYGMDLFEQDIGFSGAATRQAVIEEVTGVDFVSPTGKTDSRDILEEAVSALNILSVNKLSRKEVSDKLDAVAACLTTAQTNSVAGFVMAGQSPFNYLENLTDLNERDLLIKALKADPNINLPKGVDPLAFLDQLETKNASFAKCTLDAVTFIQSLPSQNAYNRVDAIDVIIDSAIQKFNVANAANQLTLKYSLKDNLDQFPTQQEQNDIIADIKADPKVGYVAAAGIAPEFHDDADIFQVSKALNLRAALHVITPAYFAQKQYLSHAAAKAKAANAATTYATKMNDLSRADLKTVKKVLEGFLGS